MHLIADDVDVNDVVLTDSLNSKTYGRESPTLDPPDDIDQGEIDD